MEIGSEFHLITSNMNKKLDCFNDENLFAYARGILSHLVKQLSEQGIMKFLIPNYLCESVFTPFLQDGVEIDYYFVNQDLTINDEDFLLKLANCQAIYLINYFGRDNEAQVRAKFDLSKVITIVDVTHNFFSSKMQASDIYIASLRKWIGIPSGAYLKINTPLNINNVATEDDLINTAIFKRTYAANLKSLYLLDTQKDLKTNFLSLFNESEQLLDCHGYKLTPIDSLSKRILTSTDWPVIFTKRRENYLYLEKELRDIKEIIILFQLGAKQVPIGFPIFIENRDRLRGYLTENQVYCPVHWPIPQNMTVKNQTVEDINSKILTIPCDQRYSIEDMKRIITLIRQFVGAY